MEVTLYQPDGPCHKCVGTRRRLDKLKIPYVTVTADDSTIDRLRTEGHSTFPVVVVAFDDDTTWTWSDIRLDYITELAAIVA